MQKIILIFLSIFFLTEVAVAKKTTQVQSLLPMQAQEGAQRKTRLWGQVVFMDAGSFTEFQRMMKRTRDDTRKMLWKEFGELFIPAVMNAKDSVGIANALAEILIKFDRMHDEHLAKSKIGIPTALERMLMAEMDQRYRDYGISDEERRAEFAEHEAWTQAINNYQAGLLSKEQFGQVALEIFNSIDYILYGSFTAISGGRVALTLTAENYRTGAMQTFLAKGETEEAVKNLAEQLMNFVQREKYPNWENPQKHLQWYLPPANLMEKTRAKEAKLYCNGQGARLPFAQELLLASQGSEYRQGGIPAIGEYDIYLVADIQRDADYYFYFGPGRNPDDPRGPVRSSAGYGTIFPRFACVKGEVSVDILVEQSLYRILRNLPSVQNRDQVEIAVEYLLLKIDSFGKRPWLYKGGASLIQLDSAFRNPAEAIATLQQSGLVVSPVVFTMLLDR